MLKLKLTLQKTHRNEDGKCIILKEQVTCVVETLETDAFLENGHPDETWLKYLAENQLKEDCLVLVIIEDIK